MTLVTSPERYERWFESPFGKRADRIEQQILGHLLSGVGEARSLLDVGCGTGHFAALWAAICGAPVPTGRPGSTRHGA